ncbi:hypothetical protein ACWDRB_54645 [Nonomuraea sp. NPDC003707]
MAGGFVIDRIHGSIVGPIVMPAPIAGPFLLHPPWRGPGLGPYAYPAVDGFDQLAAPRVLSDIAEGEDAHVSSGGKAPVSTNDRPAPT